MTRDKSREETLLDKIDDLHAEIERLKAAHDDYVVAANNNVCALNRDIERMKAENARLYALADAAWDEGFKQGDAMARAINDELRAKP